jgi:TRAP-type C4-dicarboxylate transport system permease small subunit
MSVIRKIESVVYEKIPKLIIGILMFTAVLINAANVIARHVFHSPIIWAEEILIFIMIWIIFTGAITVSRNRLHLKMDLVANTFPKNLCSITGYIIDCVTLLVCLIVTISSSHVLMTLWTYDQRSVVAEIPMVIPHFAVFISFFTTAVWFLIRFLIKRTATENQ